MLGLKLNHVSKRGACCLRVNVNWDHTFPMAIKSDIVRFDLQISDVLKLCSPNHYLRFRLAGRHWVADLFRQLCVTAPRLDGQGHITLIIYELRIEILWELLMRWFRFKWSNQVIILYMSWQLFCSSTCKSVMIKSLFLQVRAAPISTRL